MAAPLPSILCRPWRAAHPAVSPALPAVLLRIYSDGEIAPATLIRDGILAVQTLVFDAPARGLAASEAGETGTGGFTLAMAWQVRRLLEHAGVLLPAGGAPVTSGADETGSGDTTASSATAAGESASSPIGGIPTGLAQAAGVLPPRIIIGSQEASRRGPGIALGILRGLRASAGELTAFHRAHPEASLEVAELLAAVLRMPDDPTITADAWKNHREGALLPAWPTSRPPEAPEFMDGTRPDGVSLRRLGRSASQRTATGSGSVSPDAWEQRVVERLERVAEGRDRLLQEDEFWDAAEAHFAHRADGGTPDAPVAIEPCEDGGFRLTIIGLPDFELFARTRDELTTEWRDALASHLAGYAATGKAIPPIPGLPSGRGGAHTATAARRHDPAVTPKALRGLSLEDAWTATTRAGVVIAARGGEGSAGATIAAGAQAGRLTIVPRWVVETASPTLEAGLVFEAPSGPLRFAEGTVDGIPACFTSHGNMWRFRVGDSEGAIAPWLATGFWAAPGSAPAMLPADVRRCIAAAAWAYRAQHASVGSVT